MQIKLENQYGLAYIWEPLTNDITSWSSKRIFNKDLELKICLQQIFL